MHIMDFSQDMELFLYVGMVQNGIDSVAKFNKDIENQRNVLRNNPPGPRGLS